MNNKKKKNIKADKEEVLNDIEQKIDDTNTAKDSETKEDDRIAQLEEELKQAKDRQLRLQAEFDNYRKRTTREKLELSRRANESIIGDFLPILDDFYRAMEILETSENFEGVKEGVHLIHNKFNEFVKQKGLEEIASTGEDFNLDLHEAITKIPAPSEDLKGKIVDCVQKGYMLNGEVIRFAKVVIGE